MAASDRARVLEICLAAFEPIHRGFEAALGPEIFAAQYASWREDYARTVDGLAAPAAGTEAFVIEEDGALAGFVLLHHPPGAAVGEIGLNAVAPDRQGRGLGTAMYRFALERLRARGATAAYVGTGGDAAHAAARAAYARVGFDRAIPSLHLFRLLPVDNSDVNTFP